MLYAPLVLRFDLGLVFVFAGLAKLRDRRAFAQAVYGYKLVSDGTAVLIGRFLPPLELVTGALLLCGLFTRAAASATALLLSVFTAAIAINLGRGRKIDCGCSGSGVARTITWLTVLRNVSLLASALFVAATNPISLAVDSLIPGMGSSRLSTSTGFALMFVAASLFLAAALVGDVRRLHAALRSPTLTLRGVVR